MAPKLDIAVPVHNEAATLHPNICALHAFLSDSDLPPWRIVIVDNASIDSTQAIAAELAAYLPDVELLRLERKGRGHALREAWLRSDAEVVCYMDVDLSTDLRALHPLVAPLLCGHSEVAIGSRLAPGAEVQRGIKRELISRVYNTILRTVLRARFSDAQCGFKALRADVARELLPDCSRRRLVLRHRAADRGPAPRPADPRGRGRLGRRPGLARRHRAHSDRRPQGSVAATAKRAPGGGSRCRAGPAAAPHRESLASRSRPASGRA